MAKRRQFTEEEKDEMVRLAVEQNRTLYYIARVFETSPQAVRYHLLKRNATKTQRLDVITSEGLTRYSCGRGCIISVPARDGKLSGVCPLHKQPWLIAKVGK